MSSIAETTPHFIRCVKPNDAQRPLEFVPGRVCEQLRCGGVMEAVRISSAGFPSRLAFRHFFSRYRILVPALLPRTLREAPDTYDYRAACSRILAATAWCALSRSLCVALLLTVHAASHRSGRSA